MTDINALKIANLKRWQACQPITSEELREILHYDPLTGLWTWLVTRGPHSKPGSSAGTIHKVKRSETPYLRIKKEHFGEFARAA